jgi:predicted site-specific integrase-resolvase
MQNLLTITQYSKMKSVSIGTVHYWIKKNYLQYIEIAGKKFIDTNSEPVKRMR